MLENLGTKKVPCTKCNEPKPWPADYITSFNKGTTESVCKQCRKIRRKAEKLKREGKVELEKGWRNPESEYRKRSCAVVRRIAKEKENE